MPKTELWSLQWTESMKQSNINTKTFADIAEINDSRETFIQAAEPSDTSQYYNKSDLNNNILPETDDA